MAKYKVLNQTELQKLENKFVEFLVVNGITADDWIQIKNEYPERAERLIELFSDVIYESKLRQVQFIELIQNQSIICFQCLENKMVLMGIKSSRQDKDVDFTNQSFLKKYLQNPPANLEVFSSERIYQETREKEIFEWLEKGALISNGSLFKTISLIYASS